MFLQVPEVRDFIYGALTDDFERSAFKKVPEKPPTAIFYDENEAVVGEVLIEEMKRIEIFKLFDSWGIPRKVLKKINREDL